MLFRHQMRPIPPGFENSEAIRKRLDEITKKPSFRLSSAELHQKIETELRWLLNFCEGELSPDADWGRLAARFDRCALRFVGQGRVWPSSVLAATEAGEAGLVIVPGWGGAPAQLPPLMTESEIRAVHVQLRGILNAFWPRSGDSASHAVRVPANIQRIHLSNDGKVIQRIYGADWPDWFWLAVASVLEKFGSHIERCQAPDCGRLFLRARRQIYCCAECSQRVRSRRWYEAHRDEARGQRREAYQKEVRRKSYAGVKVQRRTRRAK